MSGKVARGRLGGRRLSYFIQCDRVAVLRWLVFSAAESGSVLLSPVWHEWHDGAFNVWVEAENVKVHHLRRDPRVTIVVAESEPPLRGVELRGTARFIDTGVTETARRIAARYVGEEDAAADTEALRGRDVIVRIEPGHVRAWDFVDEFDAE